MIIWIWNVSLAYRNTTQNKAVIKHYTSDVEDFDLFIYLFTPKHQHDAILLEWRKIFNK